MIQVFYKFSAKALRLHPDVFDEFDRIRLIEMYGGKVGLFGYFRTKDTEEVEAGTILGIGTRLIDSYVKLCKDTEVEELLQLVDSLQLVAKNGRHLCQGKLNILMHLTRFLS